MIIIYSINLEEQCKIWLEQQSQILFTEEEKINIFSLINVNRRFVSTVSRIYLKLLLSKLLKIPNSEILFDKTNRNKPFLLNYEYHFNITHGKKWLFIAFSKKNNIGIDYSDKVPSNFSSLQILQRYFYSEEVSLFNNNINHIDFMKLWAYKEATAKATGDGIAYGFKSVKIKSLNPIISYLEKDNKFFHIFQIIFDNSVLALAMPEKEIINISRIDHTYF